MVEIFLLCYCYFRSIHRNDFRYSTIVLKGFLEGKTFLREMLQFFRGKFVLHILRINI